MKVILYSAMFWLTFSAVIGCSGEKNSARAFDPNDEAQLVEIYCRSNYFNDGAVMGEFGLEGKTAAAYTAAISERVRDPGRWQSFNEKVKRFRSRYEQKIAQGKVKPARQEHRSYIDKLASEKNGSNASVNP